jgi:hypothetical protein
MAQPSAVYAEHQDDDSDKAEDERADDKRSYAFGFMSGRVPDIHRATRVAAWLMSRRYKVEVTANDPLPPDIPRDEWVDQIKSILEALRERSRRQG